MHLFEIAFRAMINFIVNWIERRRQRREIAERAADEAYDRELMHRYSYPQQTTSAEEINRITSELIERSPRAQLRNSKARVGFKVDIEQNYVGELYDLSNDAMILSHNHGFYFGTPVEFEATHMHVFPKNVSQAVGGLRDLDGLRQRYVELGGDDEISEVDARQINEEIDNTAENYRQINETCMLLENLEIGLCRGVVPTHQRRMSLMDPYWKHAISSDQDKDVISKVNSIFDLCALARLGYSMDIRNPDDTPMKFTSQEHIHFEFNTRNCRINQRITLEIALDGIIWTAM